METKPLLKTRERVLSIALQLFNEFGAPHVTTSTICERSNISPGNLYYYFKNKDDIIDWIFKQFKADLELRLVLPTNVCPSVRDIWFYLQDMSEFLWSYRFLYLDINDLLIRSRTFETQFKFIVEQKIEFAKKICSWLIEDDQMRATPEEIMLVANNIALTSTFWLSYQFIFNPRKYNEQAKIRDSLHSASSQILSILAPYLRGTSLKDYKKLAGTLLPLNNETQAIFPFIKN